MREFILGTDWWTDCDDAVALRLLARAHKAGDIRLRAIGLNACMEHSIPSVHAFLTLEGVSSIPLGLDAEATDFGGAPPYQKRLAALADPSISNASAEDAVRLYRKTLAAAPVPLEIIEIGYPQVLASLLQSPGDDVSPLTGLELVRQKVSHFWVMAGKWDEEVGRENNFARNPRARQAAAIFCSLCPCPVTFLGWEIGADVISGRHLLPTDPLHLALADHGSASGRSSWDPMLTLLALESSPEKAGYSFVQGRASVDPITGENRFVPAPDGPHRYVRRLFDPVYYEKIIDRLVETR